jgi:hypothetical protein
MVFLICTLQVARGTVRAERALASLIGSGGQPGLLEQAANACSLLHRRLVLSCMGNALLTVGVVGLNPCVHVVVVVGVPLHSARCNIWGGMLMILPGCCADMQSIDTLLPMHAGIQRMAARLQGVKAALRYAAQESEQQKELINQEAKARSVTAMSCPTA